jgi:hypothetical protein
VLHVAHDLGAMPMEDLGEPGRLPQRTLDHRGVGQLTVHRNPFC